MSKVKPGSRKNVLILLENQVFIADPRVKNEGIALRDAGWDVHVICPQFSEEIRRLRAKSSDWAKGTEGIHVHDYPVSMAVGSNLGILKEYLLSIYHIAKIAFPLWRKHRFAVVHLCNPPDYLFAIAFFFRLRGSKVVFDHHDLFPEMLSLRMHGLVRFVATRVALLLEYLTFRTSNFVISTNESYKGIAVRRGHVPPEHVYVVRNGPVLARFVPVPPEPNWKVGFKYMACYAGVMNQEDGVLELVDAIRHIVVDLGRKDIIFYLLGNGGMLDAVVKRIEDYGLSPCVKAPGLIVDSRIFRSYLSTADVLLAPELPNPLNDKSTFIKVAEYMAIGKPIVAYDLKESRYTAGDAAVYATPGDTTGYAELIVSLLNDPARSARMGEIGQREVGARFSWEKQREVLVAAYEAARNKQT